MVFSTVFSVVVVMVVVVVVVVVATLTVVVMLGIRNDEIVRLRFELKLHVTTSKPRSILPTSTTNRITQLSDKRIYS